MRVPDWLNYKKWRSNERVRYAIRETKSRFNIRRIDGVDYVTLDGIIISRPSDNDLLDRLEEFRNKYIEREKQRQ